MENGKRKTKNRKWKMRVEVAVERVFGSIRFFIFHFQFSIFHLLSL